MKALVTGGSGFVGSQIVRRLLERGDSVRSISRRYSQELAQLGADVQQVDICDEQAVRKACSEIDTVFHVAAHVELWGPWWDFYRINVVGTRNLLQASRFHKVKRFVYTSSPSVVAIEADLINATEKTSYPPRYTAYYPHTKSIAEREVVANNGRDGLSTVSLRPHLIWGPGDTHLVPQILARAKSGKLRIIGNGNNLVDWTYIDNVVDAHLDVADALAKGNESPAGRCYFIGQGEPIAMWEFVRLLCERYKIAPPSKRISYRKARALATALETAYKLLPLKGQPRITRFLAAQLAFAHHFSIKKASRDFGYQPRVSLAEGLARLGNEAD